jgi:diacylglycerol kinase (ATP)
MSQDDICVIFNPSAGRGRAAQVIARLRRTLGTRAQFWPTRGPQHAEELAAKAAGSGFATVAAAGGDGTVHEVINGLMRARRSGVTFAVIPIGSANDYAHSLNLTSDWWQRFDPVIAARPVDIGLVRSGTRSRYFCNGLGLGFNGFVTLESRRITFLRGIPLYGLALLRALFYRFATPPMTVQLDDQPPRTGPTLALSLALGRREGNFVVAPDALLDDGAFDFIHVGALRRRSLLGFLPGLVTGSLPSHPEVCRGRCRSARVQSQSALIVHVDGEFFCQPGDGVCQLEAEVLPGALRVLGRVDQVQPTGADS